MKQTVEEAAKVNAKKLYPVVQGMNYQNAIDAFKAGAEWQKNNQWISVEDELPSCSDKDLLLLGIDSRGIANIPDIGYMHYSKDNKPSKDGFVCGELIEVTHWLPFPSFDEILEENKDVLKRIKENGD